MSWMNVKQFLRPETKLKKNVCGAGGQSRNSFTHILVAIIPFLCLLYHLYSETIFRLRISFVSLPQNVLIKLLKQTNLRLHQKNIFHEFR